LCYEYAYGTYDKFFYGCRQYSEVAISATKIKFGWTVSLSCCGFTRANIANATKTVTLTET
jgi:hypothetical protein